MKQLIYSSFYMVFLLFLSKLQISSMQSLHVSKSNVSINGKLKQSEIEKLWKENSQLVVEMLKLNLPLIFAVVDVIKVRNMC